MSDVVSALRGAKYEGFCKVEEAGLVGMVTLRGDLASKTLAAAVKAATGADMPDICGILAGEKGKVAWMSPDELLLMVDHGAAEQVVSDLSEALSGEHALAVNVSDARAVFHVSGDGAREVVAKLSPADMAALEPGTLRRSRVAQVPAAFHMDEDGMIELVCFRSVATYVFGLLENAARPGSEVGYLT
ncbi:sarcosine oxidase subunit gamma family protein [Aliiroseovarius sp.]|uniref:sarcosine oxidase subunit gamma n=1 Tax=Aliiroseovarius sp. TaxID=1872442 RepID=UPI00260B3B97|nr:sarcosine oxidase subunit gamma family protein [Aliiroseovarius sp.]